MAVLVAYGVANIAAALPLTPGGLGVVEATVSGILVGFGTPRSIAIWGVMAWRLVNFWLPIPIGGAAYLSLKVHPPADNQAGLAPEGRCGGRVGGGRRSCSGPTIKRRSSRTACLSSARSWPTMAQGRWGRHVWVGPHR